MSSKSLRKNKRKKTAALSVPLGRMGKDLFQPVHFEFNNEMSVSLTFLVQLISSFSVRARQYANGWELGCCYLMKDCNYNFVTAHFLGYLILLRKFVTNTLMSPEPTRCIPHTMVYICMHTVRQIDLDTTPQNEIYLAIFSPKHLTWNHIRRRCRGGWDFRAESVCMCATVNHFSH